MFVKSLYRIDYGVKKQSHAPANARSGKEPVVPPFARPDPRLRSNSAICLRGPRVSDGEARALAPSTTTPMRHQEMPDHGSDVVLLST
jgi:hypothetical protein